MQYNKGDSTLKSVLNIAASGLICGFCLIPCCMNVTKDAYHSCTECGRHLGIHYHDPIKPCPGLNNMSKICRLFSCCLNLSGVPGVSTVTNLGGGVNLPGIPAIPNITGMPGQPQLFGVHDAAGCFESTGLPGVPDAAGGSESTGDQWILNFWHMVTIRYSDTSIKH